MDEWIRNGGFKQVVEIAAGYSPRGLMFAGEGIKYVEVDLPNVSREKAEMCKHDSPKPTFLAVSVTASDFVDRVMEVCDPALPTVIVNEGMSMYFSRADYIKVLRNIRALSERLNAVYLTDVVRDARSKSWLGAWTEIGKLAIWAIADRIYMYAKNEDDVRKVFTEAGMRVRNIYLPAKEKKYTLGKTPAITDFVYLVEASA
jgi:O-methyltransferase involved in polyketide biosynthesis